MPDQGRDFESSELGTQEYWNGAYQNELHNFELNSNDEGEVWFGEDTLNKIVKYIDCLKLSEKQKEDDEIRILDLGCGNGMTSISIHHSSSVRRVTGVDYSPQAITLAKSIAKKRNLEVVDHNTLWFEVGDVCDEKLFRSTSVKSSKNDKDVVTWSSFTYDVIVDKGTYDAISLSPDSDALLKRQIYKLNVSQLMKTNKSHLSLFIITSCNWTSDELETDFSDVFDKVENISTPQFMFGGRTGNRVSILVFKLK